MQLYLRLLAVPSRPCRQTCRPPAAARAARAVQVCAAFSVGHYQFPDKNAARDKIKQLLRSTFNGTLVPADSEDGQLLLALIQQHPKAEEKIGCGVAYFTTARRWDNGIPTKHFVLHRIDGTSTDFSYLKCLKMKYEPRAEFTTSGLAAAAAGTAAAAGVRNESIRQSSGSSNSSSAVGTPYSSLDSSPDSCLQSCEDLMPHISSNGWQQQQQQSQQQQQQQSQQQQQRQQQSQRQQQQRQQQQQQMPPDALRRKALRTAVFARLSAFKAAAFSPLHTLFCPVLGVPLNPLNSRATESEATPFVQLIDDWLQQEGLDLQDVQVGLKQGQQL
jgi:hypothetical protein